MTAVPPEAVDAAVAAIERALMSGTLYAASVVESDAYYRVALEAAAPHIRKPIEEQRVLSAIFACNSADCPRPFALHRGQDVTGVSGTGTVAHGVQFADGTVVIRWLGEFASTVVWESLDAAMKVHGHDGKTRVVWVATDFSEMALAEKEAAAAERDRIRKVASEARAVWQDDDGNTRDFAELLVFGEGGGESSG